MIQFQRWDDLKKQHKDYPFTRYILSIPGKTKSEEIQFHRHIIKSIESKGFEHCKNLYTYTTPQTKNKLNEHSIWIIKFNVKSEDVLVELKTTIQNNGCFFQSQIQLDQTNLSFKRVQLSKYYKINLSYQVNQTKQNEQIFVDLFHYSTMILLTFCCQNIKLSTINQKIISRFSGLGKISHTKYFDYKSQKYRTKVVWVIGFNNSSIFTLFQNVIGNSKLNFDTEISIYHPTCSLILHCENYQCKNISVEQRLQQENTKIQDCYNYISQISEQHIKDKIKLIEFRDKDDCIIHFFSIFTRYKLKFLQFIDLQTNSDQKNKNNIIIQYQAKLQEKLNNIIKEMVYDKGLILYAQKLIKKMGGFHFKKFIAHVDPNLLRLYFEATKCLKKIKIYQISNYFKFKNIKTTNDKKKLNDLIQTNNLNQFINQKYSKLQDIVLKIRDQEALLKMYELAIDHNYRFEFIEESKFIEDQWEKITKQLIDGSDEE